jgi:methionine-rich copper-binding protein CopC
MKIALMNLSIARALIASVAIASAQLAQAHAYPQHQAPAAGATVSSSPNEVSIEFDDGLEPAFSSIAVTDKQGKPVTSAKSVVDPADKKHMSVALNALTPGVYSVAWVAVADDGHRTQGHYSFTLK